MISKTIGFRGTLLSDTPILAPGSGAQIGSLTTFLGPRSIVQVTDHLMAVGERVSTEDGSAFCEKRCSHSSRREVVGESLIPLTSH